MTFPWLVILNVTAWFSDVVPEYVPVLAPASASATAAVSRAPTSASATMMAFRALDKISDPVSGREP